MHGKPKLAFLRDKIKVILPGYQKMSEFDLHDNHVLITEGKIQKGQESLQIESL